MTSTAPPSRTMSLQQRLRSSRLLRYGMAALGPIGGAVTQFVLSVQMLHALPPASFGSLAFLLVLLQLGTGISSALFGAPLPIVLHREGGGAERGVLAANLAFCAAGVALFVALGLALGLSTTAAVLFALYAGVMFLRWLARAHGYATERAVRTMTSDMIYSLVLAVCIVVLWFKGAASVADPAAALLVSAAAGLVPFGASYLKAQFRDVRLSDLKRYRPVWVEHARWALVGVVTTEATVNAHAYIVTLAAGPSAFAPLAATALLIRPIGVVVNALGEYERPRLAGEIAGQASTGTIWSAVRFMWRLLAVGWLGSAVLAAGLLAFAPGLVFPPSYAPADLALGMVLWLAIAAIRCWRAPESTLLQAAGKFRGLAYASIASCWISIAAVGVMLWMFGPLWSLLGVMLGEIVFAIWVAREARRWRKACAPNQGRDGMERSS